MARSSVNDAAREMMAAIAKFYKDTQGSLTSAGTASAFTLTTNSAHAALADQSLLVFTAHAANNVTPTLNVDSLGAKTVKTVLGADLPANAWAADQVIIVAYNATDGTYNFIGDVSVLTTLTTAGDLLYRGASALSRLAIGTAGQILQTNSGATAPEWASLSSFAAFPKAIILISSLSGTPAATALYNGGVGTLSVTDNGVGDYTLNWTNAVTSPIPIVNAEGDNVVAAVHTRTSTSAKIRVRNDQAALNDNATALYVVLYGTL